MKPTKQQLNDPNWWDAVAPEGATHFDPEDDDMPWMKKSVAGWHVYREGEWSFPFDSEDEWITSGNFNRCIERPTTQWKGPQDGRPPVGFEGVEVLTSHSNEFLPCEILAHFEYAGAVDPKMVLYRVQGSDDIDYLPGEWFRPIQSERDKFADWVIESCSPPDVTNAEISLIRWVALKMYNEGCRKVPGSSLDDEIYDDLKRAIFPSRP